MSVVVRRDALISAAAYAAGTAMLFHGILADPTVRAPLAGTGDVAQMTWFLAWTPWALVHGTNPLVTHMLNAPTGVNLMWNTAMPLAGLVMAPVTLVWGPVLSLNVLFMLSPVLTSLTARWWLQRHVDSSLSAAVGGAALGFGPFVGAHLGGHLNFTLLALVPVILRWGEDVLRVTGGRRAAVLLGAALAAQVLLSEEVVLLVLIGALTFLLAMPVVGGPSLRVLRPALPGLVTAATTALLLTAVPLAVQLFGPDRVRGVNPYHYYAQPRDLIIPSTHVLWGSAQENAVLMARGSGAFEDAIYLGLPALALLVGLLVVHRRSWQWRAAALVAVVAVLLSLGKGPQRGWAGIEHPFALLLSPPVMSSIVPTRFGLLVDVVIAWALANAVAAAARRWRRGERLLGAVGGLAVGAVLITWLPTPPPQQTTPALRASVSPALRPLGTSLRVLVLPAPPAGDDAAMLFQALTGFHNPMVDAYALQKGPDGRAHTFAPQDPITELSRHPRAITRGALIEAGEDLTELDVQAVVLLADRSDLYRITRAVLGSPDEHGPGLVMWRRQCPQS